MVIVVVVIIVIFHFSFDTFLVGAVVVCFFLLVIFAWQANKVKHHFALKKNYFELNKMRLCMHEYKFYTVVVFVVEMCFVDEKRKLGIIWICCWCYCFGFCILQHFIYFSICYCSIKMYVLCNILLAQMRLRIQWYKIKFHRADVDGIIGWEYKPIIYILMFLPSAHSYFFLFFSTSDYAIDVFIFALFHEFISISSMSNHLK